MREAEYIVVHKQRAAAECLEPEQIGVHFFLEYLLAVEVRMRARVSARAGDRHGCERQREKRVRDAAIHVSSFITEYPYPSLHSWLESEGAEHFGFFQRHSYQVESGL
jgi:hypothetical protein